MRVGVIGLGRQAKTDLIPALLRIPDVQVTAVCDTEATICEAVASSLSATAFSEVSELSRSGLFDCSVVAVPHDQHLTVVAALAPAGKPILKEKPFGRSLAEAFEIVGVARKHEIEIKTIAKSRFRYAAGVVRDAMASIGPLVSGRGFSAVAGMSIERSWRASRSHAGGGAVLDVGYHLFDMLVSIFGSPTDVRVISIQRHLNLDVEQSARLTMKFAQVRADFLVDLTRDASGRDEWICLVGERGSVWMGRHELRLELDGVGQSVWEATSGLDLTEKALTALLNPNAGLSGDRVTGMDHDVGVVRLVGEAYASLGDTREAETGSVEDLPHCASRDFQ